MRNAFDALLIVTALIIAGLWSFAGMGMFAGHSSGSAPPGAMPTPTPTPTPPPGEPHLWLDPQTATVNKGGSFTLNVKLNTRNLEVGGVDAYLEFDHSKITLTGATDGGLLPSFSSVEVSPGRWRLTATVTGPGDPVFTGEGTFATVRFSVGASTTGQAGVAFGSGSVLSVGGQDIDPVTRGGTYPIS